MISEEFIDLVQDMDRKCSSEDIKQFNDLVMVLQNKADNEGQAYFFKTLNTISEKYVRNIQKDSFQWTSEIGTEFKNFFMKFKNLRAPIFIELANTRFIEKLFDIRYFPLIIGVNLGRIGGSSSYDESMRAHSHLLRFFVNFYLKKALAFKPILKSHSLHLYDPCFREKIRDKNQNDSDILSKLFTDSFNVKSFIVFCANNLFPNVSWRWLGGGQFSHYITLKMILILFEYGLWKFEELDGLLSRIYEITEILCNLESTTQRDCARQAFRQTQMEEWAKLATKCRKKIASIILHIVMMHLDVEIMSVLPQFEIPLSSVFANYPHYVPKTATTIENLFYVRRFKKKRLYTYFSYSLVTYLVRPMELKNQSYPSFSATIYSKSLEHIVGILLGYISDMENNMFSISLNTLQSECVSFYLLAINAPVFSEPLMFEKKFQKIINNMQIGFYGQLTYENNQFFDEVTQVFKEIVNFFNLLPPKIEVYRAYQLAFLNYSIPQFVLSLLHYTLELGVKEKNVLRASKLGVATLISICHENNQAINNIFSHYNFQHLQHLMERDVINGVYLVVKLFGKSSTLYILEKSDQIMQKLLANYRILLDEFVEDFKEWNSNSKDKVIDEKTIAAVIIYNKLFRRILKNSSQSNFVLQILICNSIDKQSIGMLRLLVNKKISVSENFELDYEQTAKIETYLEMIARWSDLSDQDKESLLYETMYTTLNLFNQSIKKVYTEKIMEKVKRVFAENSLARYSALASSRYGLKIFKVVIQLFSEVMIFHQNHLLNRESLRTKNQEVMVEEYLRKEQIDLYVYEELASCIQPIWRLIDRFRFFKGMLDFLLIGYLPAVFKLFSGLLTHFTENKFKEIRGIQRVKYLTFVKMFLDNVLKIKESLEKEQGVKTLSSNSHIFIVGIVNLLHDHDKTYFYPQTLNAEIDTFRFNGYQLVEAIVTFYLFNEKKVPHISELVRYNYLLFEDTVMQTMNSKLEFLLKYRNEVKKREEQKAIYWDKSAKSFTAYEQMQADTDAAAKSLYFKVKDFDFDLPDKEKINFIRQTPRKTVVSKRTIGTDSEPEIVEWSKSEKGILIDNVIVYFKERYKFMKAYFLDNNNSNQIFIVFRLEDVIKQNVKIFVDFFFQQINKMDLTFDNLEENFFTKEFYFSLFVLVDNLVRTSKDYRQAFYNQAQTEVGSKAIGKIWDLHRMLMSYCLYSTFLDSVWRSIFAHYFVVSNFIQNLCEDNFFLFKRWFSSHYPVQQTSKQLSYLEEYYALLETAIKHTELAQYNREDLSVSDRPELFHVYNRLVEGLTEFINGGKSMGQELIFYKRIDIFVGIVMRVIDDVDSGFYTLKYNVLLYICALLEGSNRQIVEFVASNFSITRVFKLIIRMLKKLYIRQLRLKENRVLRLVERSINSEYFIVTKEDENKHSVDSPDQLLDFYKKYKATFSDHVIMNSLISLYSFVRSMGDSVVRYKNFLEDINLLENNAFVERKKFQNESYNMESITIWHFLKQIIVEIEILFKDTTVESDEKPKLIIHRFKKLPMCYFLTDSVKENFMFYVSIESIDLKHDEFFQKEQYHRLIMRDLRLMYKHSKFLFKASTEDYFRYYMQALYLNAVAINILFLIFNENGDGEFLSFTPVSLHLAITILAAIDAFFSLVILIFWYFFKYPIIKKTKWENYFVINKRKKPPLSTIFRISTWESVIMKKHFRTFSAHIILSLLGLFVSPFFYTLLLLLIVDLSFLVYSVVISFIKNYDKLAYTLLMILVVVNFFSYLASDLFESHFALNDETNNLCVTYFTCLANGINVFVRSGGGVGDKMIHQNNNKSKAFVGRFFFDIMFFILVNIILLGMFFGIIVDSFKDYRNKLELRKFDQENVCFTCGLRKDRLEKAGIDFDKHVNDYHDIWNYLFYAIYLRYKPQNSYDAIDLYINENMNNKRRRNWMPIGTTMRYPVDHD